MLILYYYLLVTYWYYKTIMYTIYKSSNFCVVVWSVLTNYCIDEVNAKNARRHPVL